MKAGGEGTKKEKAKKKVYQHREKKKKGNPGCGGGI